jgi:hypothetical protein
LAATKMLIDMLRDVEQKTGVASPPAEVVEQLVERIRHQALQEIAEGKIADPRKSRSAWICDPGSAPPAYPPESRREGTGWAPAGWVR